MKFQLKKECHCCNKSNEHCFGYLSQFITFFLRQTEGFFSIPIAPLGGEEASGDGRFSGVASNQRRIQEDNQAVAPEGSAQTLRCHLRSSKQINYEISMSRNVRVGCVCRRSKVLVTGQIYKILTIMPTLENSGPGAVQQTHLTMFIFSPLTRTFHFHNYQSWLKKAKKSVFLPTRFITFQWHKYTKTTFPIIKCEVQAYSFYWVNVTQKVAKKLLN